MEENEIMSIEATGKSVDEAIFKGLQTLGISIDEVSIEILRTETKGILGIGAKPAIVRLTRKPAEELDLNELFRENQKGGADRRDRRKDRFEKKDSREKPAKPEKQERPAKPEKQEKPAKPEKQENAERAEKPRENVRETNQPKAEHKPEAGEPAKQDKPQKQQRPANNEKNERPAREERPRRQEKRPEAEAAPEQGEQAAAPAEAEPAKPIEYTLEAAEGNPAAEFVQGLIEHMGATGRVLAAKDEDCLRLRIDSEMMGMLIGHRGETLDAMQYLTGLVVNKNRKTEGYTRVTLNTEEYREKREETLKRLAKKVAAQVKATGRPRVLEPMNPYERRVLHSTLQNNPDVTTHSEGEEPNRRVVVTPKRKSRSGYSKSRPNRRNAEKRPAQNYTDDGDNGTISREEYEKLYEAARAASPMFMNKPAKED